MIAYVFQVYPENPENHWPRLDRQVFTFAWLSLQKRHETILDS